MFSAKVDVKPEFGKVERAASEASYRNLTHAAFSIGKKAKASIRKSKWPSNPGEPPHTRGKGRKNLRAAIFTAPDRENPVVGPRASVVGQSGMAHEFGGKYEGDDYDERPFMLPALEASLDRFAEDWRGSIGE